MNPCKAIATLGTLPLLVLPFLAVEEAANYRYAFAFLVPALWAVYCLREWLALHPVHYVLYALAVMLHNLGALGFYAREFAGLAFDTYVHFYFGLVGGLIAARALHRRMGLHGWGLGCATILAILGLGALHELMEVSSTLVFGQDSGMYKMHNSDELDTQKDLLNNLLGCICALALAVVARALGRRFGASSNR